MLVAWSGWLWAFLPILYSNRNLVESYALPSAATIAPTSSISMSISLQEKVGPSYPSLSQALMNNKS